MAAGVRAVERGGDAFQFRAVDDAGNSGGEESGAPTTESLMLPTL